MPRDANLSERFAGEVPEPNIPDLCFLFLRGAEKPNSDSWQILYFYYFSIDLEPITGYSVWFMIERKTVTGIKFHTRKENCHHDHISLNWERIRNLFI